MIPHLVKRFLVTLDEASEAGDLPEAGDSFDFLFETALEDLDYGSLTDRDIDERQAAAVLAAFPCLTPGAAELVRSQRRLFAALETAIRDKEVRGRIRAQAELRGQCTLANRIVRDGQDIARAIAKAAEDRDRKKARTEAAEPTGLRLIVPDGPASPAQHELIARYPGLASVMNRTFDAAAEGRIESRPTTLAEILDDLDSGADPNRLRLSLKGLAASELRMALLVLFDAHRQGLLPLPAESSWAFLSTAVALYMQVNGYVTAYRMLAELAARDGFVENLTEGERLRFFQMRARAAIRSGRVDEAVAHSHDAFTLRPERGDVLVSYINALQRGDPQGALALAEGALQGGYKLAGSDFLYLGEVLLAGGSSGLATAAFLSAMRSGATSEGQIGLANVALARGGREAWLQGLRSAGELSGLRIQSVAREAGMLPFALVAPPEEVDLGTPPVAVVMTSFNSAETLEPAMRSVLAQTVRNLELHVVDDGSSDASRAIIARIAAEDNRVRPHLNEQNLGTYRSKNRAIAASDAEFVTFHDSDDWIHPTRLRVQLAAMADGEAVCSTSQWLRMDRDGRVVAPRAGGYLHLNPASTLFRRTVFDTVGMFDSVRTGADAEFLARVTGSFGSGRIRRLPACLGIGLHHEASLTQSGVAAFDEHRFAPVRAAYTEAWLRWHIEAFGRGEALRLDPGAERPFEAPREIV